MDTGFSYSPGANVYHDLIFTLFLVIITVISYWFMFYGLRRILKSDRERVMNKEPYVVKLIFKTILLLYPVALLIGFPLFVNLLSSSLLLVGMFLSLFDSSFDLNIIVLILSILLYVSYIYFYFRRVNNYINHQLEDAIDFYSDWDPLTYYGPDSIDPALYESRRHSTIWTIGIYKFAIHFSVVPVCIVTTLNFIYFIITK